MDVRGSLLAGLLLALVASPAAAQSTRAGSTTPSAVGPTGTAGDQAQRVGGLLGFERASGQTGLALRVDGELPIQALAPQIALSGVGSLGFTHWSESGGGVDVGTSLFKIVPAARFTVPLAPQLGVYGDAGIGLYYVRQTVDLGTFGGGSTSHSAVGLTLRFAAGGFYDVNDKVRLGAEVGFNPYFGDFDTTSFSMGVTALFRI